MATPIKVNIEKFTENDIVNWQYVGRGGFSNVYKGQHKKLHMSCAVKHFFECVSEEEARNLLQAQNMHVIRLLGLYKETGFTTGLVLEWMPNGSVEELNKRIETGWPLRLRILYEVSLGMNLLHQQHSPMLHLDLKPANVLLDEHLHAKISDFGLAKVHQSIMKSMSDQNKEMSSNCCGTLRYMAPEMLDSGSKPTTMCDIYSYAILIWAVMTREEPFPGAYDGMIEFLVKEPCNKRPTIPKQETSCPADLIKLMEECWHSQPTTRPSFLECVARMEAMQKTDEIKESVDKALVNLQELENTSSLKYSFCNPPSQHFRILDVFDAKSPIQEATPPGGQDEAPGRSAYNDKPTNQEPRRVTNATPTVLQEEPGTGPSHAMAEQAMAHNDHHQTTEKPPHVMNYVEPRAHPPHPPHQQHITYIQCSTMKNAQIGSNNTMIYYQEKNKKKNKKKKEPKDM